MKVGIIVAMVKELELLKPLLQDITTVEVSGSQFLQGRVGSHDVIAVQCGIGKVNAAVRTTVLIENFHPELVINTGVAGGASEQVNVMDMVVGGKVCYHDMWCCNFEDNLAPGQVPGMPLYFEGSRRVLDLIDFSRPAIHNGVIASGDQFIDSIEKVNEIKALFPGVLAVDMESGSIAHVCHLYDTPFVSMRVISDSPGAGHNNVRQYTDFWVDAPKQSMQVVKDLLTAL